VNTSTSATGTPLRPILTIKSRAGSSSSTRRSTATFAIQPSPNFATSVHSRFASLSTFTRKPTPTRPRRRARLPRQVRVRAVTPAALLRKPGRLWLRLDRRGRFGRFTQWLAQRRHFPLSSFNLPRAIDPSSREIKHSCFIFLSQFPYSVHRVKNRPFCYINLQCEGQ
jgi:hypothetical protein